MMAADLQAAKEEKRVSYLWPIISTHSEGPQVVPAWGVARPEADHANAGLKIPKVPPPPFFGHAPEFWTGQSGGGTVRR